MSLVYLFGGLFGLMVLLVVYVLHSLAIYLIARRLNHEYDWLAFVPLGNVWLLCDMAGREWWWLLLLLVPFIGFLAMGWIGMGLAEAMDQPGLLGLLMVIPVVSLLFLYYLTFAPRKQLRSY